MLKSARYASAIKSLRSEVVKRASPGERTIAALFPNAYSGWPGGWSQNRLEQVYH